MTPRRSRPGYIFLISVLAVGAIVTTVVTVLLMTATTSLRSALSVERAATAHALAYSCAEHGLRSLWQDPDMTGGDTLTMTGGTCVIRGVGGWGNEERALCVEATSGDVTRRFEIDLALALPTVQVTSWAEVPAFTLCP